MPYADPEQHKVKCREWHTQHREQSNARRKAVYYASDKTLERQKRRAWYEANIEKAKALERARQYKVMYGFSVAEYDAMLARQGGECAICGASQPSKRKSVGARYHHRYFAVDHCHETKRIRGLLCVACNVGLGKIESWYVKHKDKIHQYLGRSL